MPIGDYMSCRPAIMIVMLCSSACMQPRTPLIFRVLIASTLAW
uniref:Uncharacterized protein n=1 Tax=Arundo donax TaxID=35708 RepID=A0A0A8Z8X2_ARUDO